MNTTRLFNSFHMFKNFACESVDSSRLMFLRLSSKAWCEGSVLKPSMNKMKSWVLLEPGVIYFSVTDAEQIEKVTDDPDLSMVCLDLHTSRRFKV